MADILLKNAVVITMDAQRRVLHSGAVAVQDELILEVGDSAALCAKYEAGAGRVIDCAGKILLPGLINCHSHAGHAIMGKLAGDMMDRWWEMLVQVYENDANAEFWRADGLLHACASLRGGITTTVNVMGSTPMGHDPLIPQSHAAGYAATGGREVLGVGIPYADSYPKSYTCQRDGRAVPVQAGWRDMLAGTEEALKTLHGSHDGRIKVFVTPHQQLMQHQPGEKNPARLTALTPMERELNAEVRRLARQYGTQVYTDTYGGWVTLAYTDKENMLLGSDVLIGMEHEAATDFRELQILAETGTKLYFTAEGIYRRVPVCEAMQLDIPVAITTNSCAPRTCLDLLEALRRGVLSERIFHDDMAYFPAAKALEAITVDAARCLGMEQSLGSLEAGKQADMALLGCPTSPYPVADPVEHVVHSAAGGDFETVLVAGQVVLDAGRMQRVDEAEVLALADEVHMRTVRDGGLEYAVDAPIWSKTRIECI